MTERSESLGPEEELDHSVGNGSGSWVDYAKQQAAPDFPGPDYDNATKFHAKEGDPPSEDQGLYRRLEAVDYGKWGENQSREAWREVDLRTMVSNFEEPRLEGWVLERFRDIEDFRIGGDEGPEAVVLALVGLFYNREKKIDVRPESEFSHDGDRRVDVYKRLRDDLNISKEQIRALRKKLRGEI